MNGDGVGTQTDLRDWKSELENLKETGNWFKPQTEVPYKILFLDEGGEHYEKEYEGRTSDRIDFQVRVSGGEYNKNDLTWTMTVGGRKSLYGMACRVFAAKGKATDEVLDMSCSGVGRDRRYTLKQFSDLMFKEVEEE